MAIPRNFLDEIKNRIPVSDIVGRKVKLTRRGREFIGLSPFKNERTPSFTVNDDKQFYHCFSSGKHGNVFDFLMETEGLSFYEAVTQLAAQAGMQMPAFDPKTAERESAQEKKRATLADITTQAAAWFQTQLDSAAGREARAYLAKRGITDALIKDFQLGYAPPAHAGSKQDVLTYLQAKGIKQELLVEAGLAIQPDNKGAPYSRFRNRLMFPIHDTRGRDTRERVIGFGGRALEADAQAKYMNSPETPLFHKGHILFNFTKARTPAYEAKSVLVVEGYMDVIGLARGGIHNAVAPLGTAITENQLNLLWRMAPEPILCFDGDEAGLLAAYRVIDRALPLLKPGFSLRFATLPHDKDPDDVVREGGREAMQKILDRAQSLIDMLWERELSIAPYSTPERRAALHERLRLAVRQITHADVRQFYGDDIQQRLGKLFADKKTDYAGRDRQASKRRFAAKKYMSSHKTPYVSREARRSALATGANPQQPRESMILLAFVRHPQVLAVEIDRLERLDLSTADFNLLRDSIVDIISHHAPLDSEAMKDHLKDKGHSELIAQLEKLPDARMTVCVLADSKAEDVLMGWRAEVDLREKFSLGKEVNDLITEAGDNFTEEDLDNVKVRMHEIATPSDYEISK